MNDDELTRRVAETLRAEAAKVKAPPDSWAHFTSGNVTVVAPTSIRRRRLVVASGLIGVVAVVALTAVLVSSSHHASTQISSTGGSTIPAPRPSAPPTTAPPFPVPVGPAGGPLPPGFTPASVTFVSPSTGWALGSAPCSTPPCTSVARTSDGGRTWVGIPAPRTVLQDLPGAANAGVSTIRFANRLDGWAFGAELWATHDGGGTWHRVTIPGVAPNGMIEDLEAANGAVHVGVIDNQSQVRVATSPVGVDRWTTALAATQVGAGPVPTGQMVLQGGVGWFLQVDRTVVGGLRLVGGQWVAWTPPCATAGGPAVLAASSATELVAACDVGLWSGGPPAERLYVSHDAGASFADLGVIPAVGVQAVAATAGRILVAGTTTGQQVLLLSTDGGRTWVPVLSRSGTAWVDVGFTTATQGVAIATHELVMTSDGGQTWKPVSFASAR